MNQQCKVCGEPAAGFHFGAFTCEGCKSFFGRTYNNLGSISECKNGGVCVINKKNRTACKACRLRKCLMVGMSKSGSRYGRRSNWFKIHCLLQEQTNSGQGAGGLGAAHFGPGGFLPSFLPGLQSQSQQALALGFAAKDGRDQSSPSQEDLALQSHLLHVAMMKQKGRERSDKSPRPDDIAQLNQLKLLAWQKEEDRVSQQQSSTTPPRNRSATPPSAFAYKDLVSTSSMFSVNFASAQKDAAMPSSSLEVFRPFLPIYKQRGTDTPSDSGASSVESADEHDEHSHSNSAFSYFKQESSPSASERHHHLHHHHHHHPPPSDFPRRKINATVTLTTADYLPHHGHGLIYPPAELVTPATSHHSLRGGDLLLASPSPGGLAVEQMEPIDLSVRAAKAGQRQQALEKQAQEEAESSAASKASSAAASSSGSSSPAQEPTAKSNPLDLSLDVKRPAAEVSL